MSFSCLCTDLFLQVPLFLECSCDNCRCNQGWPAGTRIVCALAWCLMVACPQNVESPLLFFCASLRFEVGCHSTVQFTVHRTPSHNNDNRSQSGCITFLFSFNYVTMIQMTRSVSSILNLKLRFLVCAPEVGWSPGVIRPRRTSPRNLTSFLPSFHIFNNKTTSMIKS